MVLELTNDNIDGIIESTDTLIIDVWAEWCGPCKMSTPIFMQIAEKLGSEKNVFAKLDAQNQMGAAQKVGVMNLPTFAVYKKGELIKKWAGADIDRLRREIDAVTK